MLRTSNWYQYTEDKKKSTKLILLTDLILISTSLHKHLMISSIYNYHPFCENIRSFGVQWNMCTFVFACLYLNALFVEIYLCTHVLCVGIPLINLAGLMFDRNWYQYTEDKKKSTKLILLTDLILISTSLHKHLMISMVLKEFNCNNVIK
jgi:hypothetical protein